VRLPDLLDEAILAVVAAIPAGRLASYADVAEIASEAGYPCGPRRVARALSDHGDQVPWWRVVQAAGTLAEPVRQRASALLAAEGVQVDGRRVGLEELRWRPSRRELSQVVARIEGGGM
jgi:alkylated DNA nucleotide flippase Atl1